MDHPMQHATKEMQRCIENCTNCHTICTATLSHCLSMSGKHSEASHIMLLTDCAEICTTSANFMLRNSPRHGLTCAVCAAVCERCAQNCESVDPTDGQMAACAAMCRQCAASCRDMANAA